MNGKCRSLHNNTRVALLIESNNSNSIRFDSIVFESNLNRGEFDSIRMGYMGLVRLSIRTIRIRFDSSAFESNLNRGKFDSNDSIRSPIEALSLATVIQVLGTVGKPKLLVCSRV